VTFDPYVAILRIRTVGVTFMKHLNHGHLLCLLLSTAAALVSCGGGGGGGGGGSGVTYNANNGVAQKGPLQSGSTVTVQELDPSLTPTGKEYGFQITSDLGTFTPTAKFGSQYLGMVATGYYYDEVANAISVGPISLNAYADLSTQTVLNVNLLTTLAYQRIQHLVTTSGMSIAAATAQAQTEVLAVFGIRNEAGIGGFSALDLSKDTDGSHILSAISSVFVYGNSSGQLSALIAKFQNEIATTGTLTDASTRAALAASAKALDPAAIASHLTAEYASEGIAFSAASISDWLDQDGDGVIGKYKFSTANATASAVYTSPSYTVGPEDPTSCEASTGILNLNGSGISGSSASVRAGDNLSLTLTAGPTAGQFVTAYIVCGSLQVARFSVQTKPLTLVRVSAIPGAGHALGLALSPDSHTLFVASVYECAVQNVCTGGGGFYAFDVTNAGNPLQLSYTTLGSPTAAGFYALALSADGSTAYVANAESGLKIAQVSNPVTPVLLAQFPLQPSGCPMLGVTLSADGTSAFTSDACGIVANIDVTVPSSPATVATASTSTGTQGRIIASSPDRKQVAISGENGETNVFPLTGNSLGAAVEMTSAYPSSAIAYIGNEQAAVLSSDGSLVSIIDLTVAAKPILVGSLRINAPYPGCCQAGAGIAFVPSKKLLYIKDQGLVAVVDVSDPAAPVLSGSLGLATVSFGGNSDGDGVAVSADGKTFFVADRGQVIAIFVSP
jgi:hypothetical protein